MDIYFNPPYGDENRRTRLYKGEVLVYAPRSSSLALVEHARNLIEAAFAPQQPQRAHENIAVERAVEILARLKPQFIHDSLTQRLLRDTLLEFGCGAQDTYQDVPRLRVAFPADYLSTGLAYAHHPHRDTWYSAPSCQLNWWMPIYDFKADQGMAFHPLYWNRYVRNGSREFNYYHWNADGRKNAAKHVKTDTRVQPHAEEPLELEPDVRIVAPAGSIILFSGAHLHSTVHNASAGARWSIDFRTVNIDDLENRRGAPTQDSSCTGTSLRDFRRVSDFSAMSDNTVAQYDDAHVSEGVAVFVPQDTG